LSPKLSNLNNSAGNGDDDAVLETAGTDVGGDLEGSFSVDNNTVGKSLLEGDDYKMLVHVIEVMYIKV
jgi:hypothetical protein